MGYGGGGDDGLSGVVCRGARRKSRFVLGTWSLRGNRKQIRLLETVRFHFRKGGGQSSSKAFVVKASWKATTQEDLTRFHFCTFAIESSFVNL